MHRFSVTAAVQETMRTNNIEPWRPTIPQESIIYELLQRNCSKPKDRWFGIKAFIANNDITGPTQYANLPDIYKHLTVKILQKKKILDILLIGLYIKMPDYPSWVIDWGVMMHSDIVQNYLSDWGDLGDWRHLKKHHVI
jgi:hypothetical protein